jgi:hypothetical protein
MWRSFAIAGMLCVLCVGVVCRGQAPDPAPPPAIKLENDKGLSEGVRFLSEFQSVSVLRWEGGIPTGWVQMNIDGKTEKVEFNIETRLKQKFGKVKSWDTRYCSGWILIGKRAVEKGAKVQKVSVSLVVEQTLLVDQELRKVACWTSLYEGWIPAPNEFGASDGAITEPGKSIEVMTDYTTIDGADYTFLLVNLQAKGG